MSNHSSSTMTCQSYYSPDELLSIGFNCAGSGCKVSRFSRFYSPSLISLGSNVRIDDFCILSPSHNGQIIIGDNVHIAPFCLLSGRSIIELGHHVNISSRVCIYSSSDDFSGTVLPGPQSSLDTYQPYQVNPVVIASHSIVGTGSVLLPGAILQEGSSVGALSLVKGIVPAFSIYAGIPAKFIRHRNKTFLNSTYA